MILPKGEKLAETWQNSCFYFEDGDAKGFDFSNTGYWRVAEGDPGISLRPNDNQFVTFDLCRSGPFEYAENPSVPLSNPGWGDSHRFVRRGTRGEGDNGSLDVSPKTKEVGRNERLVFENGQDVHYQVFCDEKGARPELTHLWASGPETKVAGEQEKFHYDSQRKEATLFGVYKSPFSDWAPHQVYATFRTDGKGGELTSLRYAGVELVGSAEARDASLREDIVSSFLGLGEGGKLDLYRTCANFAENRAESGSSAQSALAKHFAVA